MDRIDLQGYLPDLNFDLSPLALVSSPPSLSRVPCLPLPKPRLISTPLTPSSETGRPNNTFPPITHHPALIPFPNIDHPSPNVAQDAADSSRLAVL